jgi:pimeloyl-ACP methyl ester carboxylesterase
VRLFAAKHPQEVAGMVLVDAAHEEQFTPAPIQEAMQKMSKMMPLMMGGISALVRSGLAALNPKMFPDLSGALRLLPPQQAEAYTARIVSEPQHIRTSSAELKLLETSYARMRLEKLKDLGDIPLVVLRHGKPQPMMASPEVTALLEETFQTLQEEMAAYSTQGRLVVAEGSGHAIHLEQPELVVDAIREVVMAARERLAAGVASPDGGKG